MHWCLWCHCPGWLFWLDRHVSSITNINQLLQPYWSPAWVSNFVMSVSVSDMIFRSSVCGYGHTYVCNHDVLLTGLHVLYKIVPDFLRGSFGVTAAPLGHIDVFKVCLCNSNHTSFLFIWIWPHLCLYLWGVTHMASFYHRMWIASHRQTLNAL